MCGWKGVPLGPDKKKKKNSNSYARYAVDDTCDRVRVQVNSSSS